MPFFAVSPFPTYQGDHRTGPTDMGHFQSDWWLPSQAVERSPHRHRATQDANRARCRRVRAGLVACVLMLAGCTTSPREWINNGFKVGPQYSRPAALISDRWIEADDPNVKSRIDDYSQWWTVFNDPVLNTFVDKAYQQNLTLRAAGFRVLQARAERGVAAGNWFPQSQQFFAEYERVQQSRNSVRTVPTRAFSNWTTGFDAVWEVDFWGRFRRAVEAADANLDAEVEQYDDVLVCLVAEVAASYAEIRTFQKRLQYAFENVESQRGSLKIAQLRFDHGAVTELDVEQAKANLSNTESLVPLLKIGLRQAQNRLCILLALPPRDLTDILSQQQSIPTAPAEIAVGVPAELLRRRPDVRRAERQIAAQCARIGIAEADLYPQFLLKGAIQVEAFEFSQLFTSASNAGFISPSFRWNLLNYGRIRNNILAQDARFQQLVVEYQETVLKGSQEVEDALVAFLRSRKQVQYLVESVRAADRSVELVMIQYEGGAVDFDRVLTAQVFLSDQQDQLATRQGEVVHSLIGVYKALGGGWRMSR